MKDRQPTNAGRVKITPENGESYYAVMEMADDPTEFGTPPIKENLLRDETEVALFGSSRDRTVNDAFFGIASKLKLISADMATIALTVKSASGIPLPGVVINGAYDESGAALITGSDGTASGYVSEGNVTLSVSGYADIVNYSETFTAAKGQSYTKTITLTTRNFLKITSSQNVKFSGNVTTVDASIGAGAGGGACTKDTSGNKTASGGGGGHVEKVTGYAVTANQNYPVIIGAGGKGGARGDGSDGGDSSFLGATAYHGTGGKIGEGIAFRGTGNGNGGYVIQASRRNLANGEAGTETMYTSFTAESAYGGGGGASAEIAEEDYVYSNGGSPGGGNGGNPGSDGTNGGGGGAGIYTGSGNDHGGKGSSGAVAIRMHLTAA